MSACHLTSGEKQVVFKPSLSVTRPSALTFPKPTESLKCWKRRCVRSASAQMLVQRERETGLISAGVGGGGDDDRWSLCLKWDSFHVINSLMSLEEVNNENIKALYFFLIYNLFPSQNRFGFLGQKLKKCRCSEIKDIGIIILPIKRLKIVTWRSTRGG